MPEQAGSGLRGVPDDTIALHSGYPLPALQAGPLVAAALARAAKDPAAARPAPTMGIPSLRHLFAQELAGDVGPDDVLVTSGGQAALVAAFRGLARPGDTVVMESPTFWGAIAAAAEAGLTVVPVAARPDGPDPAELARVLAVHGARLVYAQPTWHNPTGATWSPAVRAAVLDVVREHGAFLVEDDWARDLTLDGRAPAPLVCDDADGHVVHLRSLTKSMAPGIRVAALVARGPALQRIRASRWAADLYVSPLLQLAAADVLAAPAWQRHLTRLRRELVARRDALVAAVREHAPLAELTAVPRGGLSLWLRLPAPLDADHRRGALPAGRARRVGRRRVVPRRARRPVPAARLRRRAARPVRPRRPHARPRARRSGVGRAHQLQQVGQRRRRAVPPPGQPHLDELGVAHRAVGDAGARVLARGRLGGHPDRLAGRDQGQPLVDAADAARAPTARRRPARPGPWWCRCAGRRRPCAGEVGQRDVAPPGQVLPLATAAKRRSWPTGAVANRSSSTGWRTTATSTRPSRSPAVGVFDCTNTSSAPPWSRAHCFCTAVVCRPSAAQAYPTRRPAAASATARAMAAASSTTRARGRSPRRRSARAPPPAWCGAAAARRGPPRGRRSSG